MVLHSTNSKHNCSEHTGSVLLLPQLTVYITFSHWLFCRTQNQVISVFFFFFFRKTILKPKLISQVKNHVLAITQELHSEEETFKYHTLFEAIDSQVRINKYLLHCSILTEDGKQCLKQIFTSQYSGNNKSLQI